MVHCVYKGVCGISTGQATRLATGRAGKVCLGFAAGNTCIQYHEPASAELCVKLCLLGNLKIILILLDK